MVLKTGQMGDKEGSEVVGHPSLKGEYFGGLHLHSLPSGVWKFGTGKRDYIHCAAALEGTAIINGKELWGVGFWVKYKEELIFRVKIRQDSQWKFLHSLTNIMHGIHLTKTC